MAKTIHIKPKEGFKIYNDKTLKPIPAEGIKVEYNSFWGRRIKNGDVVLVEDVAHLPQVQIEQVVEQEELFAKAEPTAKNKQKNDSEKRGK